MKIDRHILLIGSSGAGKSSIAKAVHEKFGIPTYDTDAWVERKSGLTIPQIFEKHGEHSFRQQEAEALEEILGQEPGTTATGGGIVGSEVGFAAVKNADATVVLCEVDLMTGWDRVRNDPNRPLAQDFGVYETRFNARQKPWRLAAHFVIDTTGPIAESVERLTQYF